MRQATSAYGMDPVADLIGGDRTVAFRAALGHATGSALCGLLLSQFWYWSNTEAAREREGWFYKTSEEINSETAMTRTEQENTRKKLKSLKVLEEELRGLPRKLYFRINKDELYALLREYKYGEDEREQERTEKHQRAKQQHREWRDRQRVKTDDQEGDDTPEQQISLALPPDAAASEERVHTAISMHLKQPDAALYNAGNLQPIMRETCIMEGAKPALYNAGFPHAITETTSETTSKDDSSRQRNVRVTKAKRATRPPAAVLDLESEEAASQESRELAERLKAAGMNASDADRLARLKPEVACRQLEFLLFKTDLENPGAYLRIAIEDDYAPPKGYIEAKQKEEQTRKAQEGAERKKAKEAAQAAQRAATERQADESIAQLKTEDPERFRDFEDFVEKERKTIVLRHGLNSKIGQRLMTDLDKPHTQRILFHKWMASFTP